MAKGDICFPSIRRHLQSGTEREGRKEHDFTEHVPQCAWIDTQASPSEDPHVGQKHTGTLKGTEGTEARDTIQCRSQMWSLTQKYILASFLYSSFQEVITL